MARIRTIKPEFPQSESTGRLSRDARLLFVQLWTIVDDAGRTRAASRMLASLLYPYDDDAPNLIDGWLDELVAEGCVELYEVDGATYLEITNFLKHQKIDRPSKSKLPGPRDGSPKPRECSRALVDGPVPVPVPRKGMEGEESSIAGRGEDRGAGKGEGELPLQPTPPPSAGGPNEGSTRGRRLPNDWQPTEADVAFAEAEGFDTAETNRQADRFRDYWRGTGKPKKDWSATWRNWIRREADERKLIRQKKPGPGSSGFGGSGHYDERGEWRDGRI